MIIQSFYSRAHDMATLFLREQKGLFSKTEGSPCCCYSSYILLCIIKSALYFIKGMAMIQEAQVKEQVMEGKICVVTGAGRGIGRTIAQKLAEAGAERVYACDINLNPDESDTLWLDDFDNIVGITVDICDGDDLSALYSQLEARHGHIDVLVNNAGVTRDALLSDMTISDWDKVLDVNLKGAFMVTKSLYPLIESKHRGSIINISSIVGTDGNIGQSNYGASKGGLIAMTKGWAKEFSRKGAHIRANCIAPGFINTEMTQAVPEKILEKMRQKIPLGHLGEPEDIAEGVLFLASDRSRYITGQVLKIDGGLVL